MNFHGLNSCKFVDFVTERTLDKSFCQAQIQFRKTGWTAKFNALKIKHLIPFLLLVGCCTAGAQTTNALADTNTSNVPDIQFQDVPIAKAIEELARQATVNYVPTQIFFINR